MIDASTAILVKSRAKYGKRLTTADFEQLLSCKSIGDIAGYLRSNTHYNVTLESVKEAAVHRGNLESLLKAKIYNDFAALCRFERSVGEHYFEFLTIKTEVDNLLIFMRYLIAGTPEKYLLALPDFFTRHSDIDFVRITECKSFEELVNYLSGTPYHALLTPFIHSENNRIDFSSIEAVLDAYMYKTGNALIKRNFTGDERNELLEILAMQGELDNIRKIYRAKKYFDISSDLLRSQLNNQRSKLTKNQTESVINCQDVEQVIKTLEQSGYRHMLRRTQYSYIDELANRILFEYCHKKMCFSRHSAVVMASVIVLFEIEIENITNIIEGKRYEISSDNIKQMLILRAERSGY